jgi:VanZ family protein
VEAHPSAPRATADSPPPAATRKRVILAWAWVVCWAAVIWILGGDYFSLAETSRTISPWLDWLIGDLAPATRFKIFLAIRKSAHFIEYGILAILTFRAAILAAPRNQLTTAGWSALFLVATLATADEWRQAFSSARSGSPYDVMIDITGGVIAILGLVLITRRVRTSAPIEGPA